MITEKVDGHVLQIGDLPCGPGKRCVIDGEDVTDRVLLMLPKRGVSHGMEVPHQNGFVMGTMKMAVQAGELP